MTDDYSDIIDLPRPVSRTRKHMSNRDRAAQFAPFAALTGFGGMITDAADRIDGYDEYIDTAIKMPIPVQPVDIDPVRPESQGSSTGDL